MALSAAGASASAGEGGDKGASGSSEFVEAFGELVARRDYGAAMNLCRSRLKDNPADRFALELRATVQSFLDAKDQLEEEDEDEELPPQLDEMQAEAIEAADRAFDAMFAYFESDDELPWQVGEQAVGIFWDPGQICTSADRRERLRRMSVGLLARLLKKLRSSGEPKETPQGDELSHSDWLGEALGQLWWHSELELEPDPWLLESCKQELTSSGGSMEFLAGLSKDGLRSASFSELTDILSQTMTVERSFVCGLLDGVSLELGYGVGEVLAEICRRPLVEPPSVGFYECFYTMVQVVYTLNCFNGHLPNQRADCQWVYAYLERCLSFWLREVRREGVADLEDSVASRLWSAEAVEAIAEAVNCLMGLAEPTEDSPTGEAIRAGVQVLLAQQTEGLFFSPGAPRDPSDAYTYIRPSWTAAAALVALDRQAPGPSQRRAAWSRHARAAARGAGLATGPAAAVATIAGAISEALEESSATASTAEGRPAAGRKSGSSSSRPVNAAAPAPAKAGGASGASGRAGSRGAGARKAA